MTFIANIVCSSVLWRGLKIRSNGEKWQKERESSWPGVLFPAVCDNIMIILAPWRVFAEFTPSSAYLWWRRTKTDKSTLEQDNKYLHFTASLSPDSICIKNNWILNCSSPIKTVSQPSDIRSQNIVHVTKTIYSRVRLSCLWLVAGCNHRRLIGYLCIIMSDKMQMWVYYPVRGETQEK